MAHEVSGVSLGLAIIWVYTHINYINKRSKVGVQLGVRHVWQYVRTDGKSFNR